MRGPSRLKGGGRVIICAFDLSLTGTGWAAANWDASDAAGYRITSGTLSPPRNATGWLRFEWIVEQVLDRCADADAILFEDLALGRNFPGQSERTGLAFTIRYMLRPRGFALVGNSQLKKFVTGTGKGEKDHMILEVYKRWGITAATNDEADAIGLLHVGMALNGLWEPTIEAQRQVLAALRNPKGKR